MKRDSFPEEVEFQVGQRVHVELRGVSRKGRATAQGLITQVVARNAPSPEVRKVYYTVMFDDDWVKKEYRGRDDIDEKGIPMITCMGDRLTAL